MGEYADMLIYGEQCSHCEVMFEEGHGHEVLCRTCFRNETSSERAGIQRAYNKEIT